jgi:carbamoyl-phosphate synthase/aspartate carbamoyltransferase/dihydroorotase
MITLPGLIDPHVHLRTPGQEYKEDFLTGTKAALAGGFTTIVDMPNNLYLIDSYERLKEKQSLAKKHIVCDVGFYFGTIGENLTIFPTIKPFVFGLKVFLSQSTGGFLVDFSRFENICNAWPPGLPLVLHVEGEDVEKAIAMAERYNQKVHLCHVTTERELQQVIHAKKKGSKLTCGVNPHYLFLTEEDFQKQGALAKMKPFLKTKHDQKFLWENLSWIDNIESDHAPHARKEKESDNPPFGVTGLETTLPLLLTASTEGKLTIDDIKRLCFDNPAKILDINQNNKTYIEIDEHEEWIIDQEKLFTKEKLSPFHGWKMKGKVKRVFLRGEKVFENGKIVAIPGSGKVLKSTI